MSDHEVDEIIHRPIQNWVVYGLVGVILILSMILAIVLPSFKQTIDNQAAQLDRRAVAQEAVNCFSAAQAEYSAAITKLIVDNATDNIAARDADVRALQEATASFGRCKS